MSLYRTHQHWMKLALELAQEAGKAGDVPVGAVIIDEHQKLIAQASNRKERDKDPTAHAEILALQQASQVLKTWHLNDCTLYVTLEPCPMCAGAIIQSRLGLLIYGVDDPKSGVIRTVANFPDSAFSNHRLSVITGVMESACRSQLQEWFVQKRHQSNLPSG
nr:nucleoside deaminase [Chroococcus sp. FPU101]